MFPIEKPITGSPHGRTFSLLRGISAAIKMQPISDRSGNGLVHFRRSRPDFLREEIICVRNVFASSFFAALGNSASGDSGKKKVVFEWRIVYANPLVHL